MWEVEDITNVMFFIFLFDIFVVTLNSVGWDYIFLLVMIIIFYFYSYLSIVYLSGLICSLSLDGGLSKKIGVEKLVSKF